jgi:hypothetical protein
MTDHCQAGGRLQEAVLVGDPADLDLERAVSEPTCSTIQLSSFADIW